MRSPMKSAQLLALVNRRLRPTLRRKELPTGVCPIEKHFGPYSRSCYDRRYKLQVWNKCDTAIEIHIDAGKNTVDRSLGAGSSTTIYTCLEYTHQCTGVIATAIGFVGAPTNLSVPSGKSNATAPTKPAASSPAVETSPASDKASRGNALDQLLHCLNYPNDEAKSRKDCEENCLKSGDILQCKSCSAPDPAGRGFCYGP
jgi:hypothetical protein